jgi:hypothetical protein
LEVLLQESAYQSSSAIFVPSTGIFISNRILRKWCCTSSTAANLTGTISAAVLGNSTFYWYYNGCFKQESAPTSFNWNFIDCFLDYFVVTLVRPSAVAERLHLLPATSGMITSGDTGTVTNTICWLIAGPKLWITTAGKVATSALAGCIVY